MDTKPSRATVSDLVFSSQTIETAGRAAYEADHYAAFGAVPIAWHASQVRTQELYKSEARAALEAVLEAVDCPACDGGTQLVHLPGRCEPCRGTGTLLRWRSDSGL